MTEHSIFQGLLVGWFVLGAIVFIVLFFIAAPYGRHTRGGWGLTINSKLGWVLMEAPATVVMAVCFVLGSAINTVAVVFLVLWETHYLQRAFIYPFGRRDSATQMPVLVVGFGFVFNIMNGYLNGRYIFHFSGGYQISWLTDPRFILGTALFVVGYIINRQADYILRGMRQHGESAYKTCGRYLFRWVSCPNYLGEIIIWTGWALATWSLPALAFAFWTAANLVPRARAHHAWYRRTFPDYPPGRKALVPGLW